MSIKTRTSGIMVDINVEPAASTTTTWDPLNKSTSMDLSNGNLTATANNVVGAFPSIRSVGNHATGKYYWELHSDLRTGGTDMAGVGNNSGNLDKFLGELADSASLGIDGDGNVFFNGTINTLHAALAITWRTGDTVGIALDCTNDTFWIRVGAAGNWNGDAGANPATNTGGIDVSGIIGNLYAMVTCGNSVGVAFTADFGATAYVGTAPAGFSNL